MKIKGWEKISGYTYKGYTIVNPIHNAYETKYEATILKSGKMTIDEFSIELIKDRSKLINKMIEWVNEKVS